jgi:ribosomal protein L29
MGETMKLNEIRAMSTEQLEKTLEKLKFDLQLENTVGSKNNRMTFIHIQGRPKMWKPLRKSIAKVKTVLNERKNHIG